MNENARKCAMGMLDADREQSGRVLQLYVTVREARELHIFAKDMSSQLSISIVTETKLGSGRYAIGIRNLL